MVHIAIMKKSWGLTQKILTGEKTIETRWYKNKSSPWNKIKKGEIIYFKDSGEPITVKAIVKRVEQYSDLNDEKIKSILKKYSNKDLGTKEISDEIRNYVKGKKYCIIIHITTPKSIKPFDIDKKGFGMMCAWMCVEDVNSVKVLK